ncbi:hypothetical protein IFM89_001082 [Coptis chinensis]|uniref:Zinc knuckle CX2CX4HX4C domain-containing protein n=1 Tax=Coptis chinensis TaxID=261450 RepID=A0A835HID6_9MAGN|nr:hypothetical protein IFM89_001082 [Coptis chinensis]
MLDVRFKYEKLDIFCYFCSVIGHDQYSCRIRAQHRYELSKLGGSPKDIKPFFSSQIKANKFVNGIAYLNSADYHYSGAPKNFGRGDATGRFGRKGCGGPTTCERHGPDQRNSVRERLDRETCSRLDPGLDREITRDPGAAKSPPGLDQDRVQNIGQVEEKGSPKNEWILSIIDQKVDGVLGAQLNRKDLGEGLITRSKENRVTCSPDLYSTGSKVNVSSLEKIQQDPAAVATLPYQSTGYQFQSKATRGRGFKTMVSRGPKKKKKVFHHDNIKGAGLTEAQEENTTERVSIGDKRKRYSKPVGSVIMADEGGNRWLRRNIRGVAKHSKRVKREADEMRRRGEGHLLIPTEANIISVSSGSEDSIGMEGGDNMATSSEPSSTDSDNLDNESDEDEGIEESEDWEEDIQIDDEHPDQEVINNEAQDMVDFEYESEVSEGQPVPLAMDDSTIVKLIKYERYHKKGPGETSMGSGNKEESSEQVHKDEVKLGEENSGGNDIEEDLNGSGSGSDIDDFSDQDADKEYIPTDSDYSKNEWDEDAMLNTPWVAKALEDKMRDHPYYRPNDIQKEMFYEYRVAVLTMLLGVLEEECLKYCSPYFSVEAFRATYENYLYTLDNIEDWPEIEGPNELVLPPEQTKQAGRPRKQRIIGEDEPHKTQRKCKKCGTLGHNALTCEARQKGIYGKKGKSKDKAPPQPPVHETLPPMQEAPAQEEGGGRSRRTRGATPSTPPMNSSHRATEPLTQTQEKKKEKGKAATVGKGNGKATQIAAVKGKGKTATLDVKCKGNSNELTESNGKGLGKKHRNYVKFENGALNMHSIWNNFFSSWNPNLEAFRTENHSIAAIVPQPNNTLTNLWLNIFYDAAYDRSYSKGAAGAFCKNSQGDIIGASFTGWFKANSALEAEYW